MEELIKLLEEANNEQELFENLLYAVLEGDDEEYKAQSIAARIKAGRDIRFDIAKLDKENEKGNKR